MYHIKTGWARLHTCALSVVLPFWEAAAVWEAFTWDHRCDDETPPAPTNLSYCEWLLCTQVAVIQGKPTTLTGPWAPRPLWSYDDFFFHLASRGYCGRHEIPTLAWRPVIMIWWIFLFFSPSVWALLEQRLHKVKHLCVNLGVICTSLLIGAEVWIFRDVFVP